ncbi:hypothetical protein EV2_001708 [Malus domestica]
MRSQFTEEEEEDMARASSWILVVVMVVTVAMVMKEERNINKTGRTRTQPRENDTAVPDLDADGSFSSLEMMLHRAIGHSDTVQLKEKARDVQQLSPADLNDRRLEIKQLTDGHAADEDAIDNLRKEYFKNKVKKNTIKQKNEA